MNAPVSENAGDKERLERISAAFQDGIVLVDRTGAVIWMDRAAQRRLDGDLQKLTLPRAKGDPDAVDCFVAPVELTVAGERLTLGVIQADEPRQGADLIAVIESVLAESTSWFSRTIVEKLKAGGHAKSEDSPSHGTTQLESLSAREREVLGLICEGHSDMQMATLLGLSENTVRNHVAALYRKIGVKRRTAAVIWARERGITCRGDLRLARQRPPGPNGHGRGGNGHDGGRPSY